MENAPRLAWTLPVFDCDGGWWFIAGRLEQFRNVWNPHDSVDFGRVAHLLWRWGRR
jgi:hypothetical protein